MTIKATTAAVCSVVKVATAQIGSGVGPAVVGRSTAHSARTAHQRNGSVQQTASRIAPSQAPGKAPYYGRTGLRSAASPSTVSQASGA